MTIHKAGRNPFPSLVRERPAAPGAIERAPGELTFKPGDIVQLRSGGRPMVVRYNVDADASEATGLQIGIHCDWHVNGRPQSVCYLEHQLERKPS